MELLSACRGLRDGSIGRVPIRALCIRAPVRHTREYAHYMGRVTRQRDTAKRLRVRRTKPIKIHLADHRGAAFEKNAEESASGIPPRASPSRETREHAGICFRSVVFARKIHPSREARHRLLPKLSSFVAPTRDPFRFDSEQRDRANPGG